MFPYADRRAALAASLPDSVEAVLITRVPNLRYLTGFTGSNGAVLLARDAEPVLAVDGRYLLQAAAQAPDLRCIDARAVGASLISHAREIGFRRIGMEASHVTLTIAAALRSAAGEVVELVVLPPIVEPLRAVKDRGELKVLQRACEITDAAFAATTPRLRTGVSERDVAWWLEQAIRECGGDGPAFDAIVAFGANSAIPHHQPTARPLAPGDLIKIDFGARYDGYHADMTRTMVLGPATSWQRELYDEVAEIQATARAACVIGAVPGHLDAQARDAIAATGNPVAHGLGHGVGLEIHEEPFLTPGSAAGPLVESMTVTIEPGIYLADRGGVRIEDTVVMTPAGAVPMTTASRDLIEL